MFLLRSNISLRLASSMCFGFSPRGFSEESRVSEVKKKKLSSTELQCIGHCVVSFVAINIKFFLNFKCICFSSHEKKSDLTYTYTLRGGGREGDSVQSKMFLIPFVSSNNSETLEKIKHT